MNLTEFFLEDAALTWFGDLGYAICHALQIVVLRDTLLSGVLRVGDIEYVIEEVLA